MAGAQPLILAIDTSTRSSVVAVGALEPESVSRRDVSHRHGSHVLEQIDDVLERAGRQLDDIGAIAVGTGPGSFTGLRVGMATAKTLAYVRSLPLVGLLSATALRQAAVEAGAADDVVVVLPAGARDHYLVRSGHDPVLVPPGQLEAVLDGAPAISLDMDPAVLGADAARLGAAALVGLPRALLAIARRRLLAGTADDVPELVPAYVALPRGVTHAADELGWSPDLR